MLLTGIKALAFAKHDTLEDCATAKPQIDRAVSESTNSGIVKIHC